MEEDHIAMSYMPWEIKLQFSYLSLCISINVEQCSCTCSAPAVCSLSGTFYDHGYDGSSAHLSFNPCFVLVRKGKCIILLCKNPLNWGFLALTESKIQTILEESRTRFMLIWVDGIRVRELQLEGRVLKADLQQQNLCPLLQAALNSLIWLSPFSDCPKYSRRPVDSILDAVFTVSPKRQYRGMVSPTTPATQGPERHRSCVTCMALHKSRGSLTNKPHLLLWYSKNLLGIQKNVFLRSHWPWCLLQSVRS